MVADGFHPTVEVVAGAQPIAVEHAASANAPALAETTPGARTPTFVTHQDRGAKCLRQGPSTPQSDIP